ncbi:MAG: non-hydrolyzing UDP-N-acetylglucosamine 2-epimerase, partial [Thermaurantiacus tibetensis]
MRVLTVLGTRPEAVKLAPVLHALAAAPGVTSRLCSTGQHRELLAPALACFGLRPDHDLALMRAGQGLDTLLARAVEGVGAVIAAERPDWVVVQGDTTTTLAAALAAFHAGVAVAHVEAGLRTRDLAAPWPEEGNRQLVARLARRHFAPTAGAAANLRAEGIPASAIEVTGNTVIDALRWLEARLDADQALGEALAARLPFPAPGRRLILATGHRRESLRSGLARVCAALRMVAAREDVEIVFLVHRNPAVGET